MSESSDYDPGDWGGTDFSSARKDYDVYIQRSYSDAVAADKGDADVKAESVETDSSSPLIVVPDQTGSMGTWAAPIFAKLGYLENEGQTYLGKDMEISFCAFGDALTGGGSERYPLQPRPFAKGLALKDRLKELVIVGGGGGNGGESSDLAALYYARKCSTPKAIRKPIIVFITDEQPHNPVDVNRAKSLVGVTIPFGTLAKDVFEELKKKFAVYVVLKPYYEGSGDSNPTNKGIYDIWVDLLGFRNVKVLPEADRVVDVIFGILAEETGRNDAFREDMEKRQTPAQRKTVYKSLGLNEDGTPKDPKAEEKKDDEDATSSGKSVLRAQKKTGRIYS